MSNEKVIGLVFPVVNQSFYTKQLLKSIEKHESKIYDKIVVCVIDNASTDGTDEFLKGWLLSESVGSYERECIRNEENKGFGPACNQGMVFIHNLYPGADILVMNNDMELLPDCLDELYKTAYSSKDIGIVGGRLVFSDGRVQHAGAFLNTFGWGQHKGGGGQDGDRFNQMAVEDQEYVTGALFFIRNDFYKKLPGFDERYSPAYFEEVQYCYEARKLGYRTVYTPFAKAIHYENVTAKDIYLDLNKVNQLSRKNQVKFYLQNDEPVVPKEDSGNPNKIMFTCKIYGEWSFSIVMRNLAKGLARNGVDVCIAPEEYHNPSNLLDWEIKEMIQKPHDYWNRVVLRSSEGDHMYLLPPGKKRVAHTTGESNRIHGGWRNQLNNVDQVITNSTFFKNVLIDNGIRTPISIVPNAVDITKYNRSVDKYPLSGLRSFNFLSMFHFGDRKAPEVLLRAFAEEFRDSDDVTLTIHSLSMLWALQQQNKTLQEYVLEVTGGVTHAPIFVTSNYIRDEIIPHFMRNFDINVLASRAEGFGNSIIESAALGIPSIVTGYSGVLDFVTDETGWKIDYKLVDIPLQILSYFKNYIGGRWAEPSVDHLKQLMRHAYNNRDEVRQKGEKAYVKSQDYSVENVGKIAKSAIFD
jgi:GT2 family glycosyltransferase